MDCQAHQPRVFFATPKKFPSSIYIFSRGDFNKYSRYRLVKPANLVVPFVAPKNFPSSIYMFSREAFNKYSGYRLVKLANLMVPLWLPRSSQAQSTCSREKTTKFMSKHR